MGTTGRPRKVIRTSQSAAGLGQDDVIERRVRSRASPLFLDCDRPPPLSPHPLGEDDGRNINSEDRGGPDTPHPPSAASGDGGRTRSTDGSKTELEQKVQLVLSSSLDRSSRAGRPRHGHPLHV